MYALLDSRGTILHAYHATKPSVDSVIDDGQDGNGKPIISAKKGFITWLDMYLLPILEQYTPKQIIAAHDGGNSYRRGLFANYKANRDNTVESLERKKARSDCEILCKQMMAALGILQVKVPETEADDLLKALCVHLDGSKLVYTVDADILQLVGNFANGPVGVCKAGDHIEGEYKGVPLNLIRLHKALTGDSSDNYSGVKGIGPVAWSAMVAEYGFDGMEELAKCVESRDYAVIEDVLQGPATPGSKVLAKVYELRKELEFYWHLAGLHESLVYRGDKNGRRVLKPEWHLRLPDVTRLNSVMEEAGALDMVGRFMRWMPTMTLVTAANLGEELAKMVSALAVTPYVAFDFETSDELQHEAYQQAKSAGGYVDVLSSKLNGCSFNYGDNLQHTIYICFDHKDTDNVDKSILPEILATIERTGIPLVVQNELFERNVLANEYGQEYVENLQPMFDTAVMAGYVDENETAGLKDSSLRYLRHRQQSYKETMKLGQDAAGEQALIESGFSLQELESLRTARADRAELLVAEELNPAKDAEWKELNEKVEILEGLFALGAETVQVMKDLTGDQVLSYGCDDSFCTAYLAHLYAIVMMMEGTMELYMRNDAFNAVPLMQAFRGGVAVDYERLSVLAAEDAVTYKESMARIRELLATNCKDVKRDNPADYIKAVEERVHRTLIDGGKHGGKKGVPVDHEGIREALEEWREEMRAQTVYYPYSEVRKPVDFKPTPTVLGKLIDKLFTQDNPLEPLAAPSATASGVTKWMMKAGDVLSFREGREEAGNKFLDLLCAAGDQLKAREGEQYKLFEAHCCDLLSEDQPLIQSGDELNFNSPKQMVALFYCKLGLPVRDRNKQAPDDRWKKLGFPGTPSTGDKAMEMALVEDCPEGDWRREVIQLVRTAKACMTKEKLYYRPWPLWRSPVDGVMHPQIRPSATTTRRPTGGDPNLLQVSKKDDGRLRKAVVRRRDNHAVVSLDFNGQELRIMTSESKDPVLLDAYIGPKKKDIHTVTASAISPVLFARKAPAILKWMLEQSGTGAVAYDHFDALRKGKSIIDHETGEVIALPGEGEWTLDMISVMANEVRKVAKAVNFLIIYGGNEVTLARNLSMPKDLAKAFIDMVLNTYKGITPWQSAVVEFAKTHGYVQTAYGSRRHVSDDIFSSDGGLRSRMERQAVNFTIQGCAADILKEVMANSVRTNLWKETGAQLYAPVYDELVASVPVPAVFEYIERLQGLMNVTPPGHVVPMLAEVSVGGYSWGHQLELGAAPTEAQVMEAIETTAYVPYVA